MEFRAQWPSVVALSVMLVAGGIGPGISGGPPEARAQVELEPRRGGKVRRAWPRKRRARKPRQRLGRWLARQVGAVRAPRAARRTIGPLMMSRRSELLVYAPVATPKPLRLVRSFEIPGDDPDYDRLTNFSWTYDSALAAMAFTLSGDKQQTDQLLSQLAALQRTDGAIEYVYNTQTGEFVPLHRAGTMSLVGLAAAQYRKSYGSPRYDPMAVLTATWLLARQELDPTRAGFGLLYGGPDVDWMSTQHNILAYFFLRGFERVAVEEDDGIVPIFECVSEDDAGGLHAVFGYENRNAFQMMVSHSSRNQLSPTPVDGPQPTTFEPGRHQHVFSVPFPPANEGNVVWHLTSKKDAGRRRGPACGDDVVVGAPPPGPPLSALTDAAELIAQGIERVLLVDDWQGLHFVQGLDDPVLPVDAQALGILFLLDRGNETGAIAVGDYLLRHYLAVDRSVLLSFDSATYNMSYEALGPFIGFRPYADLGAPDTVWMEGTGEARFAIAVLGDTTAALDTSVERWRQVTHADRDGLLGSNRTVFDPDFNEYHVWPTSAATSWYLLSHADPAELLFTTRP